MRTAKRLSRCRKGLSGNLARRRLAAGGLGPQLVDRSLRCLGNLADRSNRFFGVLQTGISGGKFGLCPIQRGGKLVRTPPCLQQSGLVRRKSRRQGDDGIVGRPRSSSEVSGTTEPLSVPTMLGPDRSD